MSNLQAKADEIADMIMALDSPREAASVIGYAQAKLMASISCSEKDAREMLSDTSRGVMTYWSHMTGTKLAD